MGENFTRKSYTASEFKVMLFGLSSWLWLLICLLSLRRSRMISL
ncbi:hypothetical protein NECAME_18774 [Necator americanus]|uniref:Uncharacterized protein n=1 Tax=Necator americanus TaxID=51031 RepID=W2SSJ1_NECAM|nr:hypothetical protein NECAME_18774 [Necator americanus]ETN72600.1 hypothetical protein NECAME_18774 [Necator americanus]